MWTETITKDSSRQLQRQREAHKHSGCIRIQTLVTRGDKVFEENLCCSSGLKCLHSSFFPLHRALELLLKSGFGECLRPQFRAGDRPTVLICLLVTAGG